MSEVEYWDGTDVDAAILEVHVRQLGAQRPNHIYDYNEYPDRGDGANCKYTHTLEDNSKVPGCIIGQAIFNITGKLVDQRFYDGGVLDFPFMRDEYDWDNGEWTDRAKFLANVQYHQDSQVSWGEAVERADDKTDTRNWWK